MRILLITLFILILSSCTKEESILFLKCSSHPDNSVQTNNIDTYKIENNTISSVGNPLFQNLPLVISNNEYKFENLFQGKNVETGINTKITYTYQINRKTGDFKVSTYLYTNKKLPDITTYSGSCEKVNDKKL